MPALQDKSCAKANRVLSANVVRRIGVLPVVSAVKGQMMYVEKDVAFMANAQRKISAAKREKPVRMYAAQAINLFVLKGYALLCVIKKDLVVPLLCV